MRGCEWRVAAGLAALMLAACADSNRGEAAADETPLRIYGNVTTIELAPVLLALDAGLYPGPATLNNGGVPNLFGQTIATEFTDVGTADVATNAETQALRVSVANPDLRIVMTVSEGLYRIVARRSAGIGTLEDLRGKRVGTPRNTSSNYFLHRMLETVGMTDADVEIVPVWPMNRYGEVLLDGTVDAITIWEPGAEYAVRSLGEDAVEFSGRGIYRELFNLNTTAGALADPAQRARIVDLVAAIIEASERLAEDPARAQELVAASANYPVEDVRQTWGHHAYPAILVPDLLDVIEAEDVWIARETGRAPRSRAELATLIDSSVIEEARARR